MSLHTAGSVSQHILTHPARLASLPGLSWMRTFWGLLSGWVPAVRHNPGFTEVGKQLFQALESAGALKKLAAGSGIREAGEGYHQVTMATVSLASPSLTRPAPTNWSALTGTVTNCFSMWQTLPTGLCL